MEGFRSVLKKRVRLMAGFNGLAVAFIALTGEYGNMTANGSENISDMIRGFQVGIFLGLQIIMLRFIIRYRKALNNEYELKRLFIEENDERTKLIKDKIGGAGFDFTLGVIATAAVMSGFIHQLVFFTLLGVLMFMALVKAFLKIYYRNKF